MEIMMLLRLKEIKRDALADANGWILLESKNPGLHELAEFMCVDGKIRKGVGFGETETPGIVYLDSEFTGKMEEFERIRPLKWRPKDFDKCEFQ
jgi:hypothetical protein